MEFSALKKNLRKDFSDFTKYQIALLGDSATQMLYQAIRGYGYDNELDLDIYEADYDQIERQILDPTSELYEFNPKFIVIFPSTQKLMSKFHKLTKPEQSDFAVSYIDHLQQLWQAVNSKLDCTIIQFNFTELNDGVFGNYANKTHYSFLYQLRKINLMLMEQAQQQRNLYINDISAIHNHYGGLTAIDSRMYVSAKMVLSIDILPEVAKNIVEIIKTANGKLKKCLILDLDNTVWGGVIGDDGLENIEIGDLGIGRAYTELQFWAKQLKERGIILAICSKNTEEIAKEPFENHPDMVLKLDDISVFVANWENKADNIKHIQSILNIGFDSMVFLDDNPFERNLVREKIPDILVPELPEDPVDYMPFLRQLNLFETATFSPEDGKRTSQYQAEAKRRSHQQQFSNVDDYLEKLDMKSSCKGFDDFHLPRIAQLIQRSNQFNLRTIRHTEQEIHNIKESNNYIDIYFTLKDQFGEHGLIGVVILEIQNEKVAFINTWVMSCRVLKRGMEDFILNKIVDSASKAECTKIIGEYIPTSKNGIVKDHYQNLGFSEKENLWELNISDFIPRRNYIKELTE